MNAPRLSIDNEIDNTIDRALSTLRNAEPRTGLNTRILASLEQRAAAPQPTRLQLSAHLTLWTATSAAVLAIASLVILHHQTTPAILSEAPHRDVQSKNPDVARPATNPETFSITNHDRLTNSASSRLERVGRSGETSTSSGCLDRRTAVCPIHDDGAPVMDETTASADLDAQALADLHAPSHPAPPLPLTAQEKLFLHMLQYGNATELAELNPAVRAQHDADETADFKAFFPDPPPLKQPGDDE